MKTVSGYYKCNEFYGSFNVIHHLALLKFFHITLKEEIVCGRNFVKINFAIHGSKTSEIRRIYLCCSIGPKKLCGILFFRLTPTSA